MVRRVCGRTIVDRMDFLGTCEVCEVFEGLMLFGGFVSLAFSIRDGCDVDADVDVRCGWRSVREVETLVNICYTTTNIGVYLHHHQCTCSKVSGRMNILHTTNSSLNNAKLTHQHTKI